MKKLLILAVAICSTLSVSAQSETKPKEEYLSTINENWFLSAGIGAEFHLFNYSANPSFDVKNNARFNFSAGKWVNPYMAFRATYAYSTFNVESTYGMNKFILSGETSAKGGIHSLGLDLMLNLSNMIGGYREDRIYVAKPFLGLEANYTYAKHTSWDGLYKYFPVLGINNEFNVSKSISINLEVAAAVTNVNMYGESVHAPLVWPIRTSVGVTYYLGRGKARKFRTAVSGDSYTALQIANQTLSSDLDKSKKAASSLARDKEALQGELEALKAQKANVAKTVVEKQVEISPVAIFFGIDKSTVTKEDIARLKYVAEILKEQPDVKFVIEGYADSAIGSKKHNQELSQKRADAVCKVLVEKYGVSSSQLEAVGKGAVNDLFDDITLNRAVITRTNK